MIGKDEVELMQEALDYEDKMLEKAQSEAPKCKNCGAPMLGKECDHCRCPFCMGTAINGYCDCCGQIDQLLT